MSVYRHLRASHRASSRLNRALWEGRKPRFGSARAGTVLLILALQCAASSSLAQLPVPELRARVTDLTGTLTPARTAVLEEKLAAFEQRKGAQVAVLMVATTQPESIEQFGIRVAEAWKLGRKGVDDGALLLVAKDDRELRIEVGYGLEGALPDATAKRIIDEIIVPHLRNGDFHGGIDAGLARMMAVIDGEPLPEPERSRSPGNGGFDALVPLLPVIFIFAVTLGSMLKRLIGQLQGALLTGAVAGAFAWLLAGAAVVALLAAVAAFALTLMSRAGPGRWASGGGGSSGWGGGRSSGGGGGFGGGGAQVDPGDYLVVVEVAGQKLTRKLRVEKASSIW